MKLTPDDFEFCRDFHVRNEPDENVVKEYASAIEDGAKFPAPRVFKNKETGKYIPIDGWLTILAAIAAGLTEIEVELTDKETDLERFVEGVQRNTNRGLRLNHSDIEKCIHAILDFEDGWTWPDTKIAKIVNVVDRTVANHRKTHRLWSKFSEIEREVERGDSKYKMKKKRCFSKKKVEEGEEVQSGGASPEKENPNHNEHSGSNCEDVEEELPHETATQFVTTLKALLSKVSKYSKATKRINDGKEKVTPSLLSKMERSVDEIAKQALATLEAIEKLRGDS